MIIQYEHHGVIVKVLDSMKGKHREFCLCHCACKYFKPGSSENCEIAQAVFENCIKFGIVTPMWECPKYESGLNNA
jgi:hypothetical protein